MRKRKMEEAECWKERYEKVLEVMERIKKEVIYGVDESRNIELGGFPEYLNGYVGIMCKNCNVVFYAPKNSKITEMRYKSEACPICGKELGLLWILDDYQPEGEQYLEEEE